MLFGLLVGALLSLIAFTIALAVGENIPFLQIAQATGSIAVGISAIVALNLYLATIKRHKSEDSRKASQEYLQEAIKILERTYDVFTDKGSNTDPPRNNRLLWLTTARMFLRYYRIRDKINQDDHDEIVKEHEEYWRVQMYNILDRNKSNFSLAYFQPSGNQYGGDTVHRDSIGVIFDFARWYDDTEDPLKNTDVITMYAKGAVPIDQHGVEEFIEQYEEYSAKIQERKKALNHGS
jgi:hypothetical protein